MKFSLEGFGLRKNTETPPASTDPEMTPEVVPEAIAGDVVVNTSRRNILFGAAALAGSTLIGEEAEAARLPGESNADYRERSLRELKERRQDQSQERIRDNRYGTRPGRQAEALPRVETKGAMTYVGFRPTEHEERILGIRLFKLVPDAASIQISLHSDRQFGTKHLQMNVLQNNGTTFSVIGAPVFINQDPNQTQNMLLINRLLERLTDQVGPR
jgi:hypothetical protein